MMERRKAISVPYDVKLDFIAQNIKLFDIIDKRYKHPYPDPVCNTLIQMIRNQYNYSPSTCGCDILWTWLGVYRKHKDELNKPKKMSKSFHHETLKERIKSVFSNGAYEDQWDILMEMFPEIYEEWSNDKWNQHHIIGHVYLRREQSSNNVISLLMPVKLKAQDRPNMCVIKILNLITGSFWQPFVVVHKDVKYLDKDQWEKLTNKMSNDAFIHLGSFAHSRTNAYLQGEHEPFSLHEEDPK